MLYCIKELFSDAGERIAYTESCTDLLHNIYPEYTIPSEKIALEKDTVFCEGTTHAEKKIDLHKEKCPIYLYETCIAVEESKETQNSKYPLFLCEHFPNEGKNVYFCAETSSTQDIAKILTECAVLNVWDVCFSAIQSSGRGQYNHSWFSMQGNVHCTFLLPKQELLQRSYATLLLGSITVRFLRSLGVQASNKWVNDIVLHNKKIAGLLVEENERGIFLGIGINISAHPIEELLCEQSSIGATHIQEHYEFSYSAMKVVLMLQEYYIKSINELEHKNATEHIGYITETMCYTTNTYIVLKEGTQNIEGMYCGISIEGALQVQTKTGIETCISGRIIEAYEV